MTDKKGTRTTGIKLGLLLKGGWIKLVDQKNWLTKVSQPKHVRLRHFLLGIMKNWLNQISNWNKSKIYLEINNKFAIVFSVIQTSEFTQTHSDLCMCQPSSRISETLHRIEQETFSCFLASNFSWCQVYTYLQLFFFQGMGG